MKKITFILAISAIFLTNIFSCVCAEGGIYDMAYPFSENGFARVAFSGKWGIINEDEEFVLDNEYDYIGELSGGRIKFKIGNLYGFSDENFNEIISAEFSFAEDFSENRACVQTESGKWGYIDENGKKITDFIFDDAKPFSSGLARVLKDGLYGYIDPSGEIKIEPEYSESYDFSCGLACVKLGDKYGYIDTNGEMKIDAVFSAAWDFCENLAAVKKDDLYSFIDTDGNIKISGDYDRATRFSEGLAPVRKKSGKYGLINTDGKLAVQHKYDFICEFSDNLASVRIDEKYGYINESGLLVIPCIYDRADSFSNGYAFAVLGEKSGYIDKTGTFIESEIFLDGGKFSGKYANVLYENNLWGYTDFSKDKNEENANETDILEESTFSPEIISNNLSVIKLKINDKSVLVDGKKQLLLHPPIIKDERTLLPIRMIAEAVGGTVLWEEETKKITITGKDTRITLTVSSALAKVNNRIIPLDVAPEIYDGVTLVPLRFIAENLGMDVKWNGKAGEVTLYY